MEPQQHRLGSLYGTVLDNENMQPVDGAIVRALRNQISDTTNSLGNFRLDSLSLGVDSVRVSSADYDTLYTVINVTGGAQETSFFLQPTERLPGYHLYVGNWGYDEVFVVDTDSNAAVDTLRGFPSVWHLALSLDGTDLYVCTREGSANRPGKVFKVSLYSKEVALIWDGIASDVFIAPNGEPYLISYVPRSEEGYIGTIDRVTNTVTFLDTLDIRDVTHNYQSVVFARNRPLMYAVTNENRFFSYDYQTRKIVKTYNLGYNPLHMVLSHDDRILYFTIVGDRLGVFDIENESLLTVVPANQLGSLALSPDGEYLYVTDPASFIGPTAGSGKIYIFGTSTHQYVGNIDVYEPNGDLTTSTDRIVLTPDGKTAYVNNVGHIFVIDLINQEMTSVFRILPRNVYLLPMVLGPKSNDLN